MPWIEAGLLMAASLCWILAYESFYVMSSRDSAKREAQLPGGGWPTRYGPRREKAPPPWLRTVPQALGIYR